MADGKDDIVGFLTHSDLNRQPFVNARAAVPLFARGERGARLPIALGVGRLGSSEPRVIPAGKDPQLPAHGRNGKGRLLALFLSVLVASCGETPRTLGILTNTLNVTERQVGPAPANIASSELESPDSFTDFRRAKTADIDGDGTAERLVELHKGVQIRGENGQVVRDITTDEYLTDFGAIGGNVVLYTYPNKERGGTFRLVTLQGIELTRWQEKPPPGRFDVAEWNGGEAIVYLQGDTVVVRSAEGEELRRLSMPEGSKFRSVYLKPGLRGTTIVLASGDGYTGFHMVAIYDQKGDLRYQEVAKEHAFGLEADRSEPRFQVVTRSSIVEYRYEP